MDDYTIRMMRRQDAEEMSLIEEQIFSHPWTKDNFLESFELENTVYLVAEQKLTGTRCKAERNRRCNVYRASQNWCGSRNQNIFTGGPHQ